MTRVPEGGSCYRECRGSNSRPAIVASAGINSGTHRNSSVLSTKEGSWADCSYQELRSGGPPVSLVREVVLGSSRIP